MRPVFAPAKGDAMGEVNLLAYADPVTNRNCRRPGWIRRHAVMIGVALCPLGFVLVPTFHSSTSAYPRPAAAKADLTCLETALDALHVACGRYPTTSEGLNALVMRPSGFPGNWLRSEEHTSELQSRQYLVCRLLLEKKKKRQCG